MVRVGAVKGVSKHALDKLYVHDVPKHAGGRGGGKPVDILFKIFHVSVLVHSLRFKGTVWTFLQK